MDGVGCNDQLFVVVVNLHVVLDLRNSLGNGLALVDFFHALDAEICHDEVFVHFCQLVAFLLGKGLAGLFFGQIQMVLIELEGNDLKVWLQLRFLESLHQYARLS